MFEASKNGEVLKADILKMVLAEIRNAAIEIEGDLDEATEVKIIRKEVKKLKDAVSQYKEIDRKDLVEKEETQLKVLEEYLPALMPKKEVEKILKVTVKELGAESMKDMGKVMGVAMKELDGKADGDMVKETVQKLLS